MGRAEKILRYLLDQSHRWAGVNPKGAQYPARLGLENQHI